MSELHPSLPEIPARMKRLPVDHRGYPVPWFVQWFDGKGNAIPIDTPRANPGDHPDFRVVDARKLALAYRNRLCWVCGGVLGRYLAFTIGPMCAVNRTSGEPPGHRECAIFSACACPFLTKPQVERRENNIPEDSRIHPAMLDRNPGVAMVWVTGSYEARKTPDGPLFTMGDPSEVLFFCAGRPATREEIMHSIDTGMPFLREMAEKQGAEALEALSQMYSEAIRLVPAA